LGFKYFLGPLVSPIKNLGGGPFYFQGFFLREIPLGIFHKFKTPGVVGLGPKKPKGGNILVSSHS